MWKVKIVYEKYVIVIWLWIMIWILNIKNELYVKGLGDLDDGRWKNLLF